MPQLPRDERETIITFDEAGPEARIFTYNPAWQRHLEKKLGLTPTLNNGYGGREYRIDKKRIGMPRAPRKLSADQRKKLGERLKMARHQKAPAGSKSHKTTSKSGAKASPAGKTTNRGEA